MLLTVNRFPNRRALYAALNADGGISLSTVATVVLTVEKSNRCTLSAEYALHVRDKGRRINKGGNMDSVRAHRTLSSLRAQVEKKPEKKATSQSRATLRYPVC